MGRFFLVLRILGTSETVRPEPVEGLHFCSKEGQGFDKLSPNGG